MTLDILVPERCRMQSWVVHKCRAPSKPYVNVYPNKHDGGCSQTIHTNLKIDDDMMITRGNEGKAKERK